MASSDAPPPSCLPINKDLGALTMSVSPTTDLSALATLIHGLEVPGVRWAKNFGTENVGFGIFELTVTAFVPQDTTTDSVMDAVRGLKDAVKSVDLVAFQKA